MIAISRCDYIPVRGYPPQYMTTQNLAEFLYTGQCTDVRKGQDSSELTYSLQAEPSFILLCQHDLPNVSIFESAIYS